MDGNRNWRLGFNCRKGKGLAELKIGMIEINCRVRIGLKDKEAEIKFRYWWFNGGKREGLAESKNRVKIRN